MKNRTAGVAWSLLLLVLILLAASILLGALNGGLESGEDVLLLIVSILAGVGYGTVGALVASRHRRNPIGWLFLFMALGLMLAILSEEYPRYALVTEPGSLPAPGFLIWVGAWMLILPVVSIPLVFLLFPTGRVHSPRWRPVAGFIVGAAAVTVGGFIVKPGIIDSGLGQVSIENPTGIEALRSAAGAIISVAGWSLVGASLLSVVAVFLRFRRAHAEERQQIKWLVYVALVAGVLFLGTIVTGLIAEVSEVSWPNDVFFTVTLVTVTVAIPAASGIAILKYRLYDIDVVINRTVVYGALAAFVTLVYVGIVVGVGALVGSRGNLFLSILATAIIALAFQPVRRWASHLANRLVYGKRATPYEVLSELARGLGGNYSADEVLPRMASIVGQGTGAARAEVWLRVGSQLRREAVWPAANAARAPLPVDDGLPSIPEVDRALPVEHQGELLGALAVAMPRGESLSPANDKVLSDVASQAGLVLRNVRLIEELRASRQRLVTAQDEERRRLERNIHDGAQQQLVALAVKLRLAGAMADRDPAKAKALIEEVRGETQEALDDLRDLARGIYPPLLADQGLPAALEAQARKAPVPVEVDPDGVGRYPQEAEAAAYFCVLEALQNVAKYAGASRALVGLSESEGHLRFSVVDDGAGFDPATTPRGSGLQNMSDRLEALGGSLEVRSTPGEGTTVSGFIPAGGLS